MESHSIKMSSAPSSSNSYKMELETEAYINFAKFYSGDLSLTNMLELFHHLSTFPPGSHQMNLRSCMILTLFQESRFIPQFPPQFLILTGKLFGSLINWYMNCFGVKNLPMALKCILEALNKGEQTQMFKFGIIALQQFINQIAAFPSFASNLLNVPDLAKHFPHYVDYIERVLKVIPEEHHKSIVLDPKLISSLPLPDPPSDNFGRSPAELSFDSPQNPTDANHPQITQQNQPIQIATPPQRPLPSQLSHTIQNVGLGQLEPLLNDPEINSDIQTPSDEFIDFIGSIFNSLSINNYEQKALSLRDSLSPENHHWLAYYIVKSRASKEINLQAVFLDFIDMLHHPKLLDLVISVTSDCLNTLLKYVDDAQEHISYRMMLKNLGSWLGLITLARNRPLRLKNIDIKLLLFEAYENGRLQAITPLVCKILEGVKHSKNFKPPNPWTTAILNVLAEIHLLPNIRSAMVFEIELLYSTLNLKLKEYHDQTFHLSKRVPPTKLTDFYTRNDEVPTNPNLGNLDQASVHYLSQLSQANKSHNISSTYPHHNIPKQPLRNFEQDTPDLSIEHQLAAALRVPTSHSMTNPSNISNTHPGSQTHNPDLINLQKRIISSIQYNPSDSSNNTPDGLPLDPLLSDATLVSTFPPPGIVLPQQPQPYFVNSNRSSSNNKKEINPTMTGDNILSRPNDPEFNSLINAVNIPPNIALFQLIPDLRIIVPYAVDSALREIISAVVERAVDISCLTTHELIAKDFALHPDEELVQRAAHLMVSSFAGSLALVTCREPFKLALTEKLRELLHHASSKDEGDKVYIEQIVLMVSDDNLELGCRLIEQAVVDKALNVIDQKMSQDFLARQEAKKNKIPFVDPRYFSENAHWPKNLPGSLKLTPNISYNASKVYRDFLKISFLNRQPFPTTSYTPSNSSNIPYSNQQNTVNKMTPQAPSSNTTNLFSNNLTPAYPHTHNSNPTTQTTSNVNLKMNQSSLGTNTINLESSQHPLHANIPQSGNTGNFLPTSHNINHNQAYPYNFPARTPPMNSQHNIPGQSGPTSFNNPPPVNSTMPTIRSQEGVHSRLNQSNSQNTNNNLTHKMAQAPQYLIGQPNEPIALPTLSNHFVLSISHKLEECFTNIKEVVRDLLSFPPIILVFRDSSQGELLELHTYTLSPSLTLLSCLPKNHEVFNLIKLIPAIAASCQVLQDGITPVAHKFFKSMCELSPEEVVPSQRMFKTTRNIEPAVLYTDVLMAVLDGLCQHWDGLHNVLTKWLINYTRDANLGSNTILNTTVAFIRYNVIDLNTYDQFLSGQLDSNTRGPSCIDFALKTLRICLIDHRTASLSNFQYTLNFIQGSSNTFHQQISVLPQKQAADLLASREALLGGCKQLIQLVMNNPSDMKNPTHQSTPLSSSPPPTQLPSTKSHQRISTIADILSPHWQAILQARHLRLPPQNITKDKEELIHRIFDEWLLISNCNVADLQMGKWMSFLEKLSKGHLLGMEEDIDIFFTVCLRYAIKKSLVDMENIPSQDSSTKPYPQNTTPKEPGDNSTTKENKTDQHNSTFDYSNNRGEVLHVDMEESTLEDVSKPILTTVATLNTLALDSLAKLVVAMMRLVDPSQTYPIIILQRMWEVVCRLIHHDSDMNKLSSNNRSYFRFILSLLAEVNQDDKVLKSINSEGILCFANSLLVINPHKIPAFTHCWLELVSHRTFLQRLLYTSRGWNMLHKLILSHFQFLYPFLKVSPPAEHVRHIYDGTLRVLLILLHDFPDFLCSYNLSLCDALPIHCTQMRNLILSACPKNRILPDIFRQDLKIDTLPEIKELPIILTNYTLELLTKNLKRDIDDFWSTNDINLLPIILSKLFLDKEDAVRVGTKYNLMLLNALILYVGINLPKKVVNNTNDCIESSNSASDLLFYLSQKLDLEGRYLFLFTICNYLRYPNAHTHYFSCFLLWLFSNSSDSIVREQIVRVLVERSICNRPLSWGTLITLIELVKNKKYLFWENSFVHASLRLSNLFQNISNSCLKPKPDVNMTNTDK